MTEPVPAEAQLITWKQVCTIMQCSRSKFFQMRGSGRFPLEPVRLDGTVRYNRREVDQWIEQGCPVHWKERRR